MAKRPLITILIPVHNEARTIGRVIKELLRLKLNLQLILIDDGCTDETVANARRTGAKKVEIVSSAQRRGKGDAIRRGLGRAKGEYLVIQDGDYEYRPSELPRLLEPLLVGEADIVYGSRFKGSISGMALTHLVANRGLSLAASLLYLTPITDEATCYKAFRADWLGKIRLRAKGFDFCPEVTARLLKRGARYREVPVSYRARTKQQGKKVRYRDGFAALWALFKYRFVG